MNNTVAQQLADRAKGYGMESVVIDGNNILTVYDTIKGVRDYCIHEQKPYLVECTTFRMRGHEEASGTKYVPKELFEEWGAKDPMMNYEAFLMEEGVLSAKQIWRFGRRKKKRSKKKFKKVLKVHQSWWMYEEELR